MNGFVQDLQDDWRSKNRKVLNIFVESLELGQKIMCLTNAPTIVIQPSENPATIRLSVSTISPELENCQAHIAELEFSKTITVCSQEDVTEKDVIGIRKNSTSKNRSFGNMMTVISTMRKSPNI